MLRLKGGDNSRTFSLLFKCNESFMTIMGSIERQDMRPTFTTIHERLRNIIQKSVVNFIPFGGTGSCLDEIVIDGDIICSALVGTKGSNQSYEVT
jgi:hypothetical protein